MLFTIRRILFPVRNRTCATPCESRSMTPIKIQMLSYIRFFCHFDNYRTYYFTKVSVMTYCEITNDQIHIKHHLL